MHCSTAQCAPAAIVKRAGARWPSQMASFHALSPSSKLTYSARSIAISLVWRIACVDFISILLYSEVGNAVVDQQGWLGGSSIASPRGSPTGLGRPGAPSAQDVSFGTGLVAGSWLTHLRTRSASAIREYLPAESRNTMISLRPARLACITRQRPASEM